MKSLPTFTLMAALMLATGTALAADQILTVAVFDFESKDEGMKDLGPKVAALLNANLSAQPTIITVERAELDRIMSEQELGLSGTVSADTAAKVGQLTGAKVIVTGRVFKVDKQTIVVAKIISTETSREYGEMVQSPPVSIVDLSSNLAAKVASVLADKADTLVAKAPTRAELIAKIKLALEGKELPVVAVNITEHHYSGPIIDPAAETEISKMLQECGFKLADANSKLKPEVLISGEAFSAYGMRKGNLISCKARIEIKAANVDTGNIIVVDRQTDAGVDIAEQTAAKTALQNAAIDLAARILPKLGK